MTTLLLSFLLVFGIGSADAATTLNLNCVKQAVEVRENDLIAIFDSYNLILRNAKVSRLSGYRNAWLIEDKKQRNDYLRTIDKAYRDTEKTAKKTNRTAEQQIMKTYRTSEKACRVNVD